MSELKDRLKEVLYIRGMTAAELARQSGLDLLISTNRPLDFIEFQAVFIFLRANFGQKKNPTAYAMG